LKHGGRFSATVAFSVFPSLSLENSFVKPVGGEVLSH
jgi:hypothetical protein